MKTKLITFFVCMISSMLWAANIEWNRISAVDAEVWDTGPLWQIGGYSEKNYTINPVIMITTESMLSASSYMAGGSTIWVKEMSVGDIVNSMTMAATSEGFFYHTDMYIDEMHSDYSIDTTGRDSVYLAFLTIAYDDNLVPYDIFGWVEIGVSGLEPVVRGSAWDVDGGAMIVGAGAAPEPTSAMLILLGLTLLVIARPSQAWESRC